MNNLNMNCVSFKGKYLIPYNQIKNEETLMNIGQASSGYVTRPEQLSEAPDGIVVDIDDKKAKEYEAVIAKYGVSIQKYDPSKAANKKIAFNGNAPEQTSETQAPEKQVAFHGNSTEKASGNFADKIFDIEYRNGINNRTISGKVDNNRFFIQHNGKLFSDDVITGQIGDKELNLKSEQGLAKNTISGTIGKEYLNLEAKRNLTGGFNLIGKYKGEDINIDIDNKFGGLKIEGNGISLKTQDSSLFGNNIKISGSYKNDPDLIPILMDIIYNAQEYRKLLQVATIAAAV